MVCYPELAKERFVRMVYWDLVAGPIVVVLTQITQRYRSGSIRRLYLNIGCVLSTLFWLYGFLGGSLTITNYWHEFPFHITYTNYVVLILFAAGLNITYYILEYRTERSRPSRVMEKSDYWYPPLEKSTGNLLIDVPARGINQEKTFSIKRDGHDLI